MAVTTRGLVAEFLGALAKGGTSPGNNTDPTSTWTNLKSSDAATGENGISYTTTDGWCGAGTPSNPYAFHPSADDFKLASSLGLASTKTFSYEAWASNTTSDGTTAVCGEGQTGNASGAKARISVQQLLVFDDSSGNEWDASAASALTDGQYHHYVGVCDGSYLYFYRDGTLAAGPSSISGMGTVTCNVPTIGCVYRGSAQNWFTGGGIATVRFYNVALSSSEVSANYAAGVAACSGASLPATGCTQSSVLDALYGWCNANITGLTTQYPGPLTDYGDTTDTNPRDYLIWNDVEKGGRLGGQAAAAIGQGGREESYLIGGMARIKRYLAGAGGTDDHDCWLRSGRPAHRR